MMWWEHALCILAGVILWDGVKYVVGDAMKMRRRRKRERQLAAHFEAVDRYKRQVR